MKAKLPSRKCLKHMIIVMMWSSVTVGLILTLKWNDETSGRRYSHTVHLPRGVFRELLSDRQVATLQHRQWPWKPVVNHSDHSSRRSEIFGGNPEYSKNEINVFRDGIKFYPTVITGRINKETESKLESSQNSGWTVLSGNVTVHVGNFSNPHNYTYVINPRYLCQSFDPDRPKVLIFIESNAINVERRKAIRNTWGLLILQQALNFRIVFGLGLGGLSLSQVTILRESYRYNDILQENFPESFHNLALKSVMGLKWVITHCSNADYVMKTDDDFLIHVPNLLKILKKYSQGDNSLLCHENRIRRILRKELKKRVPPAYGKYIVKNEDLPGEFFPPYCAGMGYIFSNQVARKLYQAAVTTPYFFIEDAYITGFCRQKAGISLSDHPSITLKPIILPQQGGCAFKEGRITSQEITHVQMREMWDEINTQGYFCPKVIGYIR